MTTPRIKTLIASVRARAGGVMLSENEAAAILRDMDTHARGLRMAGKSAIGGPDVIGFKGGRAFAFDVETLKHATRKNIMGIPVVESEHVPEGELWVQQSGRAQRLCPFHGNAYKSGECAVCQSITGLKG